MVNNSIVLHRTKDLICRRPVSQSLQLTRLVARLDWQIYPGVCLLLLLLLPTKDFRFYGPKDFVGPLTKVFGTYSPLITFYSCQFMYRYWITALGLKVPGKITKLASYL
jgi:hypothetical protein